MAAAPQRSESYKAQREVEDLHLVLRARSGNRASEAEIIRRYAGFVRLRSSSYFIAGGDPDDLVQEGLVGLYKAIRDYRVDKDTTFRSFAELCITRQIITAIKTATRHKHAPLNGALSLQPHAGRATTTARDFTLGDALPGSPIDDPARRVVATRGAGGARRLPRLEPLAARGARAHALPRGPLLRGDRRDRRVRPEGRRQRPAARQAQGRPAPGRRAPCSTPDSGLRALPASPRPAIVARALAQDDAREADAVGQRPELNRRGERAQRAAAEPLTGTSLIDETPTILALTAACRLPECSVARPVADRDAQLASRAARARPGAACR